MAVTELTISDLRNLGALTSNLLFPADSDEETFNLSLNTLFEYTKDRLGLIETGCIEMYMGEVTPPTHTELDGKSFAPLIFPKMGALFPDGKLPDTRGMILKHAPDGRLVLSFEAEAVLSHTHTATFEGYDLKPHNHSVNGFTSTSRYVSSGNIAKGGNFNDISRVSSAVSAGKPSGLIVVNSNGSPKNLVDNIAVKFIIKKA